MKLLHPALRDLIDLLKQQGVPYSVEDGKRHLKLFVNYKLATVVNRGSKPEQGSRGMRNAEAAIKRAGREARMALGITI